MRKPRVWFIILAGGKRALDPEKAPWRPKLLENLLGQPVIHYVLQAARGVKTAHVVGVTVVISSLFEEVLRTFLHNKQVKIAVQEKHRGTADAVWNAIQQGVYPRVHETDYVVVLMGDQPLVRSLDIDQLVLGFNEAQPKNAGIISFHQNRHQPEFQKCGVIIRDKRKFCDIRARIPIPQNVKSEELHAGPYIFNAGWLRGLITILGRYQDNFPAHVPEFHLYDALVPAVEYRGVHVCRSTYPSDFLGVDTREALKIVQRRLKRRLKRTQLHSK